MAQIFRNISLASLVISNSLMKYEKRSRGSINDKNMSGTIGAIASYAYQLRF